MSNIDKYQQSFGREAVAARSPEVLLNLERQAGKLAQFEQLDALIGDLLVRSLRGQKIAKLVRDKVAGNTVTLEGLSAAQRTTVGSVYDVAAQQSRGAWYLPASASTRVGLTTLPYAFQNYGRFPTYIALEERGSVQLADNPAAVFMWSVLEPLFSSLFLPFELRGPKSATKSREEQLRSWAEVDNILGALGFTVERELAVMRYGGGWSKLRPAEQLAAKQHLLSALAQQVHPGMGALYRAFRIQELLAQYYKKAKAGRAKRTQVLTKAFERTLSGFFGGDWLVLLAYLEEEPHADEQVATALPEPRLYATGGSRAAQVAAQLGIPVEEAERAAAAYWGGSSAQTPVERRVAALKRFWHLFDEIHSRQTSKMKPLWGLVEDYTTLRLIEVERRTYEDPYQPELYRKLLPGDLIAEIEALWGTTMLPRWPESIVTEPFPHAQMARSFGPALTFWQGVALTAWFICMGPMSRTDLPGLATYHASHLAGLKEIGTPINQRLFQDLIAGEKTLGAPQTVFERQETTRLENGLSFTISLGGSSRRSGFENLRDIITTYRRAWADQYLDQYLRARWETDLRSASRAYNVALQDKGKAPTTKQFAKPALVPTVQWFGGDISALYAAIGEKSPIVPQRRELMRTDKLGFGKAVLAELRVRARGSNPTPPLRESDTRFESMAQMCLGYIQLQEALGSAPRRQEFSSLNTEYYWSVLADSLDDAVTVYGAAIDAALRAVSGHTELPKAASAAEATILPVASANEKVRHAVDMTPKTSDSAHIRPALQQAPTAPPDASSAFVANEGKDEQKNEKRSWLGRLLGKGRSER